MTTIVESKRAKTTKVLIEAGIKCGTDMTITQTEQQQALAAIAEADTLNKEYIELLKTTHCPFCTGWGHSVTECTVFKAMEDFARTTPALWMAWGKYKSDHIKTDVEDGMQYGMVGMKRNHDKMMLLAAEDLPTGIN